MLERLGAAQLARLLEVTRALATPLDLSAMLDAVREAALAVLRAERCSVWLHDAGRDELVLRLASDLHEVRLPVGMGLIGACARERRLINVPDCCADPRFDRAMDPRTGYRTRCALTLPLLDQAGGLVGVMQLLDRVDGSFDGTDELLAQALAAQCAVALQRARMAQAVAEGERLRQELAVARVVQTSTLPTQMPQAPGYTCHGLALPAEETGGDTFDLATTPQGLLVVLADATGHGIGPALSVTQMHAMLRMALRLGTPLEQAGLHLNNLMGEVLAEDRFVTAFVGLLDTQAHVLRYFSAGQGPILLWRAADSRCAEQRPTGPPLGAIPLAGAGAAREVELQPGDRLVLLSDGFYEQEDGAGQAFGVDRVRALLAAHRGLPSAELAALLLAQLQAFAGPRRQDDDVTVVLVQRCPLEHGADIARDVQALPALFELAHRACSAAGLPDEVRGRLDFVLEELFTNLVKYGGGQQAARVRLQADAGAVQGWIEDPDGTGFDPLLAPEVDTSAPAEQRRPGGLGLHLVRRLADALEYLPATAGHGPRLRFVIQRRPAPPDA